MGVIDRKRRRKRVNRLAVRSLKLSNTAEIGTRRGRLGIDLGHTGKEFRCLVGLPDREQQAPPGC